MKATLNGTVLAEAPASDLAKIEGNWYFPPASVTERVLVESPTQYTCPWKGPAQYFNATVDGEELADKAWSYPNLKPSAVERVGTDFNGWIAFDPSVDVSE